MELRRSSKTSGAHRSALSASPRHSLASPRMTSACSQGEPTMNAPSEHFNRSAYIDLIKRSITNYSYLGGDPPFEDFRCVTHYDLAEARWNVDPLARPLTLLTKGQLDLIENAVLAIEERNVPGDFIEAGVWRGGVIIFLRALINAYGIAG